MNPNRELSIGPRSFLTLDQVKRYGPKRIDQIKRQPEWLTAVARFDDRGRNGYNSFGLTAEITDWRGEFTGGGACHDVIAQHFPELEPLVKWHMCSTQGPLHYVENTLYWLGRRDYEVGNIFAARTTAIWPDMPEGFLITGTKLSNAHVEEALRARLPRLLAEFRAAMEEVGFTW